MEFDHSVNLQAVISRGEYGVLGPDGNCWPQMAGMIPLPNNEVLILVANAASYSYACVHVSLMF